jgi:outer membrane lipoprotein-sorting protein
MKARNFLFGLAILLAASNLKAQNSADVLVRTFVDQLKSHKNLEMVFNYQFSPDGKNFSDPQQGHAWLQGESYRIEMAEQQNISDGKTIWTYLIDEEEVMVSDAAEGDDNTPLKLLTSLDENYAATVAKMDNNGICTVELANPKGQYKRITLKINTKTTEIKSADIYVEDGSKMVINIEELKFDQELDDKFFTFDEKKHPHVDVIDMR